MWNLLPMGGAVVLGGVVAAVGGIIFSMVGATGRAVGVIGRAVLYFDAAYATLAQKWAVPVLARARANSIPQAATMSGFSSTVLRSNIAGFLRKKVTELAGYAAHHLIPVSEANHWVVQALRMDLDDATNGILLHGTHHAGPHGPYRTAIREALDAIGNNASRIADQTKRMQYMQKAMRELQERAAGHLWEAGAVLKSEDGATVQMWRTILGNV
jgi:hypothetical protein